MRSRTSRGVPEWSGGEDLYMGGPVLVTGQVSGFSGNVPGPPGGSRGSTKWGHQPRRTAWAKCGRGPAPGGLVHPPQGPKAPRVWGGGSSTLLGGQVSPLSPPSFALGKGGRCTSPLWGWSLSTLGPCKPPGPVAPLGGPPGPSRWSRYVTNSTRNFSGDQNRTSHI